MHRQILFYIDPQDFSLIKQSQKVFTISLVSFITQNNQLMTETTFEPNGINHIKFGAKTIQIQTTPSKIKQNEMHKSNNQVQISGVQVMAPVKNRNSSEIMKVRSNVAQKNMRPNIIQSQYQQAGILQQGLPNDKNLCYLNVIMQCLYAAQQFRQKIISLVKSNRISKTGIISALANIFKSIKYGHSHETKNFNQISFIELLKDMDFNFEDLKQQDSMNYFFNIINQLISEQISLQEFFLVDYSQKCGCQQSLQISDRFIIDGIGKCHQCGNQVQKYFKKAPINLIIVRTTKPLKDSYEINCIDKRVLYKYQCISCVEYIGNGNSGHYRAFRKHKKHGWFMISDNTVIKAKSIYLINQNGSFLRNIVFGIYFFSESFVCPQVAEKLEQQQIRRAKLQQNNVQTKISDGNYVRNSLTYQNKHQKMVPPKEYLDISDIKLVYQKDQTAIFQLNKIYSQKINILFKKDKNDKNQFISQNVHFRIQFNPQIKHEQHYFFDLKILNYFQLVQCPKVIHCPCKKYTNQFYALGCLKLIENKILAGAQLLYDSLGPKQFNKKNYEASQITFNLKAQQQEYLRRYQTFRHKIPQQTQFITQRFYKVKINTFKPQKEKGVNQPHILYFSISKQRMDSDECSEYQVFIYNYNNFVNIKGTYRYRSLKLKCLRRLCNFLQQQISNEAYQYYQVHGDKFSKKDSQAKNIHIDLTGIKNLIDYT